MNGTYKAGTYKGLDLAFGRDEEAFGGILIRSVCSLDNKFIEGPCLTVDNVLDKTKSMTIKGLVEKEDFNWNAFDEKSVFYLR